MEINKFLERFHLFYDSVIRNVKISFQNKSSATSIEIIISARDRDNVILENAGWVNVFIEIDEVIEFNFCEYSKESYQVLSNGLHIIEAKNFLYFDFGFHIDVPKNFKEFKKSNFYVVGKNLTWTVKDYQDFS
jgi:hypothetical protein